MERMPLRSFSRPYLLAKWHTAFRYTTACGVPSVSICGARTRRLGAHGLAPVATSRRRFAAKN
jgi:hypothetical protein